MMSLNPVFSMLLICLGGSLCGVSTAAPSLYSSPGRNCARRCPKLSRPVCGSDGVTYDNECFFGVANCRTGELEIVKHRACDAETPCLKPCAKILRPVCGDNGETYPNECELKNGNCYRSLDPVTKVRDGRCGEPAQNDECPQACTLEYNPVCGSDGVTYPTRCVMNAETCRRPKEERPTVAHSGECVVATTVALTNSGPSVQPSSSQSETSPSSIASP